MLRRLGPLPYVLVLGVPFIPICVDAGLLGDASQARSYLETLWQVVAATLGLSIALFGFVSQGYANAAHRAIGGSLRELSRATGLQAALAIGFAALVTDGMVLLGLGQDAPAGWAAASAIGVSALTLGVALPFVFFQALRAFEFEFLVAFRRRVVEVIVDRAMDQQLRGQAGNVHVDAVKDPAVTRGLWVDKGRAGISFDQPRAVRDVKLAPLRKLARHATVPAGSVELLVSLDERVPADRALVAVPTGQSRLWVLAVRACFKTRRFGLGEDPRSVLAEELERLHQAAKAAIVDGRKGDWDLISDVYADALLAMPRATQSMSVPFAGAVASPGFISLGPLDRVTRFMHDEIETALNVGDRELALDVAYFPMRVARDAADLDAPGLVRAMLSLYPSLYRLASS